MPTLAQIESARAEWSAAPHTERTAVASRWAAALGISLSTLYRAFRAAGSRGPDRPREPARPEIREWAAVLMTLMSKSPEGTIPLGSCLRAAMTPNPETGEILLPPDAERVPLGTYARVIRDELGGRETQRRNRRLHAEDPNQAWLFDASTSKYLIVAEPLDDGDYTLRLHRNPMPASGYKNKPLGEDRLRLLYYGVWDMATGYQWVTPKIARGESGLDAIEAVCAAMAKRDDPRDPLHGVPTDLWSDQGNLLKNAASRDLLDRLGINVVTGKPYQKERMGGVEQVWRRLWQWEATLFLAAPARGRWTITISQLQARLGEYLAEVNARPSRNDRTLSRAAAWTQGINRQGGARLCPERPLETIASEVRRWVDGAGIIRWNNIEYEVPELHRTWVIARRALDGSERVVVEHEDTGKRYDVTPFKPLAYGEFKGSQPALPIEKARVAAETLPTPGDIYAPKPAEVAPNVVTGRFGPRQQPARDLPDPLDAEHHASLAAAMADFGAQFNRPLSLENRALVEQRLITEGLTRTAVRDLAAQLTTLLNGATS
jgi:hypothetical protein